MVAWQDFQKCTMSKYIEGKKEIRDINMEFNGHYLRGDMDKGERRSCPM